MYQNKIDKTSQIITNYETCKIHLIAPRYMDGCPDKIRADLSDLVDAQLYRLRFIGLQVYRFSYT
jgi:hypothetical protein